MPPNNAPFSSNDVITTFLVQGAQASSEPWPEPQAVVNGPPAFIQPPSSSQASLEKAYFLIVDKNNKVMSPRVGLYEAAILEAEELVKKYGVSMYIVRCIGVVEYKKPELKEIEE